MWEFGTKQVVLWITLISRTVWNLLSSVPKIIISVLLSTIAFNKAIDDDVWNAGVCVYLIMESGILVVGAWFLAINQIKEKNNIFQRALYQRRMHCTYFCNENRFFVFF